MCLLCEPGARYDQSEVIDDYSRGVMTGLRFGTVAGLYRTAADWSDQIKGIDNASEADSYKLRVGRTSHSLTFEMSDEQGHKGHLKFMVPLHVRKFHVHTKPELPKGKAIARQSCTRSGGWSVSSQAMVCLHFKMQ